MDSFPYPEHDSHIQVSDKKLIVLITIRVKHRATQVGEPGGSSHGIFFQKKIVYQFLRGNSFIHSYFRLAYENNRLRTHITIKINLLQFHTHMKTLWHNSVMHRPTWTYTLTEKNTCAWLFPIVLLYGIKLAHVASLNYMFYDRNKINEQILKKN